MLAATLWALDGLVRSQLTQSIPSTAIVLVEHVVGFLLLLPFFIKSLPAIRRLARRDWLQLLLLTVVSSALGTILFTEAFARSGALYDFATPILLQKLQPLFVVLFSWMFLRERLTWRFFGLGILAIVGSYMVSFGAEPLRLTWTGKEMVVVLAVGAALAWGLGTILSKNVLRKLSFGEATSLRFLLAIPVSAIFMFSLGQEYNPMNLEAGHWLRFLIIGLTTGAGAILLYYRGLKVTEAKVATFCELMFPIVSLVIAVTALNPFGTPQVLSFAQILGIVVLFTSIVMISTGPEKREATS
jgi:drug/metabolite transporter (DMT)-like permease